MARKSRKETVVPVSYTHLDVYKRQVWDEPLNYVDIYSRMHIENLIKKFSPIMIFVEHDLAFRNNVATRSIRLTSEVTARK